MKLKHVVATGIIAIVTVWMLIPREGGAPPDEYPIPNTDATITAINGDAEITNDNQNLTVRVANIDAQTYVQRVRVRGQTQAFRHVEIRAEVTGTVIATPVIRGARVNAGDVLCEIAEDARAADLQEARSREEEAQLEYDGVLDLQERGLQSRVGIAQQKAALDSARAAVKRAELALSRTKITAPFAGVMETREVEVGDLMDMGGVCATLLDDTPMLLVGLVPEQDVGKLFLAAPVTASLLTGQTVQGAITYIARAADTSARSYRIEVEIESTEKPIRQGITAEMYVAASEIEAHLIPPSALTLNDAGAMGVKTLDHNNVVHFAEVSVVGENTGTVDPGMWVTGLPRSAKVITHGQEIVFPGEQVSANADWSSAANSAQRSAPGSSGSSSSSSSN